MDKCSQCSKDFSEQNYYTLQKGSNNIELCETCYKGNETQYIVQYSTIVRSGGKIIKEPKPVMDDGKESNYFECKKCKITRNYENAPASEFGKGCPNCQSKNFEMKVSLWNGDLHYQVKECSKCHKMDIADLFSWPDSDKTRGKNKQEVIKIIKQENLSNQDNCQCVSSNDRERERERERAKLFS